MAQAHIVFDSSLIPVGGTKKIGGYHARREAPLGFLRYLASVAHLQDVHFLWRPFLRDPEDDMVLECAMASGSQFIVTHNMKDFGRVEELKVQAIKPADFLRLLRSRP